MLHRFRLHSRPLQFSCGSKLGHAGYRLKAKLEQKYQKSRVRGAFRRQRVHQWGIYRWMRRTGRAPTYSRNLSGLHAPVSSSARLHATRTIFLTASRKIAGALLDLQSLRVKAGAEDCCPCLEESCHRPPREETERLQRRGEKETQVELGSETRRRLSACCDVQVRPDSPHMRVDQTQLKLPQQQRWRFTLKTEARVPFYQSYHQSIHLLLVLLSHYIRTFDPHLRNHKASL